MKYLIEIHQGIGDVVQMTGLIDTIYENDDKAETSLILSLPNRAELFKHDPRIKNIYYINLYNKSFVSNIKTAYEMRKQHFDYAFFSSISDKIGARVLAFIINAKNSYGEQFVDFGRMHKVEAINEHIVKKNANLLMASGLFEKVNFPKLVGVESYDKEKFENKKVMGLCIGTSKPSKTWPLEKYLSVADYFGTKGYEIIFLGGKQEAAGMPLSYFENHMNWHNYLGKTTLLQSAGLLTNCNIMLGGDTGLMHMAAALDVPTITIFSCTDPDLHAPYSSKSYIASINVECQYCVHVGTECKDYKCLNGITTNMIIDLINKVIEGKEDPFIKKL